MPSLQNIEYKSSWHGDYLKWICGFANEQGEITTSVYTELFNISERTARNDLSELIDKQIFKKDGETNLAKYIFA